MEKEHYIYTLVALIGYLILLWVIEYAHPESICVALVICVALIGTMSEANSCLGTATFTCAMRLCDGGED
jgi:hypothetical protein